MKQLVLGNTFRRSSAGAPGLHHPLTWAVVHSDGKWRRHAGPVFSTVSGICGRVEGRARSSRRRRIAGLVPPSSPTCRFPLGWCMQGKEPAYVKGEKQLVESFNCTRPLTSGASNLPRGDTVSLYPQRTTLRPETFYMERRVGKVGAGNDGSVVQPSRLARANGNHDPRLVLPTDQEGGNPKAEYDPRELFGAPFHHMECFWGRGHLHGAGVEGT